jgi:hypothetical protein
LTRTRIAALLLAVSCALVCAGTAQASKTQTTMLQDDPLLLGSADTRDATLDEWKSLGVDTVKVGVSWRTLAPSPDAATKPAVDLTNPASYDQTAFQKIDGVVQAAQARGFSVYFQVKGAAPVWASGKSPSNLPPGVQKPNAADYKEFIQAVGTRYSGNYDGLPRVDIWSVWNEPNLASWLNPQYSGKTPYSPRLYRDLLYAARDGLNASGHADDQLLIGELLPFARGSTGKTKVRPIEFLRELACVDKRYRPYKGRTAKKHGCSDFQPLPGTSVSYHPYTLAGGPKVRSSNKDDATIAELPRVISAMDKIAKAKRFATTGKLPLALTEFGFQTDPPDPVQSPIKEVPGFMGESEWLAWSNPRVSTYSQYPFNDDAIGTGENRFAGFQSGLNFEDGRHKRVVYAAFQYPFFVRLVSASKVEVFGGVRAAGPGAQVTIQSRTGKKKFKDLPGGALTTGDQGYFDKSFKVAGAKDVEFRFLYGKAKSRDARPVKP